jgi:hypothetical protein
MPPATSDDPNRQYSQSWEDEPTFNTDQSRPVQEHEPSGKSKKKNKKKAKAAAKALTETPPDHLYDSLRSRPRPKPISNHPKIANTSLQAPSFSGSPRRALVMP